METRNETEQAIANADGLVFGEMERLRAEMERAESAIREESRIAEDCRAALRDLTWDWEAIGELEGDARRAFAVQVLSRLGILEEADA